MENNPNKADEGLDYLDKKQKKKVGWWLLLWFIMPFTAFMKLDEILGEDGDRKEYPPEPNTPPTNDPNTSSSDPQNP